MYWFFKNEIDIFFNLYVNGKHIKTLEDINNNKINLADFTDVLKASKIVKIDEKALK